MGIKHFKHLSFRGSLILMEEGALLPRSQQTFGVEILRGMPNAVSHTYRSLLKAFFDIIFPTPLDEARFEVSNHQTGLIVYRADPSTL